MKRFVSFSGGADSTALAIYLAEAGEDFELVFEDTGAELPETYWIVPRVARALEKRLIIVSGSTFFHELAYPNPELKRQPFMLPGYGARWCTRELKQKPFYEFVKTQGDCIVSIGIRADEQDRLENGPSNKPKNCKYDRPLVDAGFVKRDVRNLCEGRGLLSPAYKWRSNTSCFCCPFQRKHDWINLSKEHPDLFALAEDWERLTHDYEIHTKHTWNDSWSLRQLREADAAQFETLRECREQACAICSW